jgi:hypothetical protein
MTRRGLFAALAAPFAARLARFLPKTKIPAAAAGDSVTTWTSPWISGTDFAVGDSVTIVQYWIRDDSTGEMRLWPFEPSPYWHGKEPIVLENMHQGAWGNNTVAEGGL